jgi:DNA topoisomerase-3
VLRESDGLGTEAKRSGIIALLFKWKLLSRKSKEIHATEVGCQLVNSPPEQMVLPPMTAYWESQLEAISEKNMKYGQFMQPLTEGLSGLIDQVVDVNFSGMKGMGKKFMKRKATRKRAKPAAKKQVEISKSMVIYERII